MTYQEIKNQFKNCFQLLELLISAIHDAINPNNRIPIPAFLLSGFAGLGKTHAAKIAADILSGLGWGFVEFGSDATASTIKKAMVESGTRPTFYFFDEAHALNSKAINFLKPVLETGGKTKEITFSISGEDFTVEVNPFQTLWVFASNESLKDSAMSGGSGRLREIQFLPYSEGDLAKILGLLAPSYIPEETLSPKTLALLSRNCRPFARSAKNLLSDLRVQGKEGMPLSEHGIKAALVAAGYRRGGWKMQHLNVLKFLVSSSKGRQVQEIAAAPMKGADSKAASALLAELSQAELITTLPNGRKGHTDEAIKLLKSFGA